jgi:acyl carrier protein
VLTERSDGDARSAVREAVRKLLRERGRAPQALHDSDKLGATLGLKSLDLAQLVFDLELTLCANPFSGLVPITSVRTIGDLAHAFELARADAGTGEAGEGGVAAELAVAQAAERRRAQRRGLT